MVDRCHGRFAEIDPQLETIVLDGLAATREWPAGLPGGAVHTDLFPDNVLLAGDRVTGLIDFYFACTDSHAYDYAVTHAAWCFSAVGAVHYPERAAALAAGYAETRGLSATEIAALPRLGEGAALRFTLTRAYDWINTPAGALVTRKDPMAFARRLIWYARATPQMCWAISMRLPQGCGDDGPAPGHHRHRWCLQGQPRHRRLGRDPARRQWHRKDAVRRRAAHHQQPHGTDRRDRSA